MSAPFPELVDPRGGTYPTEAADGTVHLAYYAGETSFVWSGNIEHPVQVCPGGYGEAVADTFWLHLPLAGVASPGHAVAVLFRRFRDACDQWLVAHLTA